MDSSPTYGLLSCDFRSDQSYCYFKVFELTISSVIVLFSVYEIYKQFELYGLRLHWKIIELAFIITSLTINIFFCLWNSTYQLFSLETFFNSMYFLTIVGDVCNMYIKKNNWHNFFSKYGFYASLIAMVILYAAILIDSLIAQNSGSQQINCEEIWYLCINVICVLLCILALAILVINQKEEYRRLQVYQFSAEKVYSPFKSLWIWIGVNTAAQVIDLVETGLLLHTTQDEKCMIVPNSEVSNNAVKFVFAILTLYLGYVATLWYLIKLRARSEAQKFSVSSSNFSEQHRLSYNLQILQTVM